MHPKALAAGRDARDVYLAALCWSNQQRTDGVIPSHALPLIASLAGVADADQAASRLCEVGLWDNHVDGWQVHDFLAYQQSKEDREAWLKSERERKQRARDARKPPEVPQPVRAESKRNPRNVRSRDVDVDVDKNNPPTPQARSKRYTQLLHSVAWVSSKATPNVRSVDGLQAKIVRDADQSGLADELERLLGRYPEATIEWLTDEHLGRPHPRAIRPPLTDDEITAMAKRTTAALRGDPAA